MTISPGSDGQLVVSLTVEVRDPAVITQLGEQLRDAYHDVRNRDVSEQPASTDYPWQFETRITLAPTRHGRIPQDHADSAQRRRYRGRPGDDRREEIGEP